MTIFRFSLLPLAALGGCNLPAEGAVGLNNEIAITTSLGDSMSLAEALELKGEKSNTFNMLFSDFSVEGEVISVPEYDPMKYDFFRPYSVGLKFEGREVFAELANEDGNGAIRLEANPNFEARCRGFSAFEPDDVSIENPSVTFHQCELVEPRKQLDQ